MGTPHYRGMGGGINEGTPPHWLWGGISGDPPHPSLVIEVSGGGEGKYGAPRPPPLVMRIWGGEGKDGDPPLNYKGMEGGKKWGPPLVGYGGV